MILGKKLNKKTHSEGGGGGGGEERQLYRQAGKEVMKEVWKG